MDNAAGDQKLQAELTTNEELKNFLNRPGLIVLDIYSGWCGPCAKMSGLLRRMKMEPGGENLHLAICKADAIDALQRFRDKSEPTWLFISDGKAVNVLYGTNVGELKRLITEELQNEIAYRKGELKRKFYAINQAQPYEIRLIEIDEARDRQLQKSKFTKAIAAKLKKRKNSSRS